MLIVSCGTESTAELEVEGDWNLAGFEGESVSVIETFDGHIFIGKRDGVFSSPRLELDWDFLGLKIDSARVSDIALLDKDEILTVVRYDRFDAQNNMLFRTSDGGNSWVADTASRIEKTKNFGLTSIEKDPNTAGNVFAVRGYLITSSDFGNTWNILYDKGFNLSLSMEHPNHLWIGGDTETLSPSLAKSTDGGKNWTNLNNHIEFGSDAVVMDVILDGQNPDMVLAGVVGSVGASNVVRKSEDGGKNWETVLDDTGVHTFSRSLQNPDLIYASGRDASTKLFFAYTTDFGETWEKQIFEEGPDIATTNDMEVMTIDGKEVIFFGTDKGLYSFSIDE